MVTIVGRNLQIVQTMALCWNKGTDFSSESFERNQLFEWMTSDIFIKNQPQCLKKQCQVVEKTNALCSDRPEFEAQISHMICNYRQDT